MAGQKIKLVISGRTYPMEAETPEVEQLMRLAAEDVDGMLKKLSWQFPSTSFEDKLMIVAVREAAAKLLSQKNMRNLVDEADSLEQDLDSYLDGKKKE